MDTLVAIFANSLVCALLFSQLVRLYKGRKARHLSIGLLVLLLPATLCWAIFGYLESKQLMFLSSIGTTLLTILTLGVYIATSRQLRINNHAS
jgi:uncharacterized protein with PQ loop repeat